MPAIILGRGHGPLLRIIFWFRLVQLRLEQAAQHCSSKNNANEFRCIVYFNTLR